MGKYLELPWSIEDTIENLKEIINFGVVVFGRPGFGTTWWRT